MFAEFPHPLSASQDSLKTNLKGTHDMSTSPASLVPAPVEVAGVSAPLAADSPAFLPTRIPSLGSQAARGQVTREACEHETQASEGLKLNRGAQQGAPPPPCPLLLPSSNASVHFLCPGVCQEAGAKQSAKPLLPQSAHPSWERQSR